MTPGRTRSGWRASESVQGLDQLSAISTLSPDQREHSTVASLIDSAIEKLHEAVDAIRRISTDEMGTALIEVLSEWAARVEREHSGHSSELTLSEQWSHGVLGQAVNEATSAMAGPRLPALEWDINPVAAIDLLRGLNP